MCQSDCQFFREIGWEMGVNWRLMCFRIYSEVSTVLHTPSCAKCSVWQKSWFVPHQLCLSLHFRAQDLQTQHCRQPPSCQKCATTTREPLHQTQLNQCQEGCSALSSQACYHKHQICSFPQIHTFASNLRHPRLQLIATCNAASLSRSNATLLQKLCSYFLK